MTLEKRRWPIVFEESYKTMLEVGKMTVPMRVVVVKQVPEKLNGRQGRSFLSEIQACVETDRPRIVLDCSKVRALDRHALHILLCCLEEAMKQNGDVKLAELPPGAHAFLEITGANRVFDTYATTAEAVETFHQLPAMPPSPRPPSQQEEQAA